MLVYALVGHLVGDYLLQNDRLAAGKKSSSWTCAEHVSIWTLCVCLLAGWNDPLVVVWLWATHFAIDRWSFVLWWMRVAGQSKFGQSPMWPWSNIVVDNTWHIVTLYLADLYLKL